MAESDFAQIDIGFERDRAAMASAFDFHPVTFFSIPLGSCGRPF
jgi:hypothetical protein